MRSIKIAAAALLCLAAAPAHSETTQFCGDGGVRYCAGDVAPSVDSPRAGGVIDARVRAFSGMVERAAFAAGVPSHLALAVVRLESGFNPAMRGLAGEWGLGQIKCETARAVGFSGGCARLAEPGTNLQFSMAYLRLALAAGGNGCAGLSLYNRGIAARPRCTAYGRRVLALAAR